MIRETLSSWIVDGNIVQYIIGWIGKVAIEGITAGLVAGLIIELANLMSKLEMLFTIAQTESYIVLLGIASIGFYPFVSCTGVPISTYNDEHPGQHEE